MRRREEIDDSVEDEEVGPRRGDLRVHGLAYAWTELSTGRPRSHRALRAGHRLHVVGEDGLQPLEWRAAM
eukprot:8434231-Pyramimonas_sp.AAC.1